MNEDFKGVSIDELIETDLYERLSDNYMNNYNLQTALSTNDQDINHKGLYNFELSWLAGVIECEGSITFGCTIRGKNKDILNINPLISIINSDVKLLTSAKRIMDLLSIRDFGGRPRYSKQFNHGSKPGYINKFGYKTNLSCKILTLRGQATKLVLQPCLGYFKSEKQHNAKIILDYLDNRKENLFKRDRLGRVYRLGYSKDEIKQICTIRQPNKKNSITMEKMMSCKNVF